MSEQQIITAFLCFWLAVFGAALGSFLDCAVSRWAAGEAGEAREQNFGGRSRCDSCGHTLGVLDLVPVFGFLLRKGKCHYCGEKIPADCLWAELAGAAALACVGWRFGLSLEIGMWLIWAVLLFALSLTDCAKRIIPDKLLLVLVLNRLVWFFILGQGVSHALGMLLACAIPAALLALVLLWEKLADKEVMGGGDIKLLFVLALYLSWAELLLTLLVGCLLGLLWAAEFSRKKNQVLPFGPFLALGALITVCFGAPLLDWYFSLL